MSNGDVEKLPLLAVVSRGGSLDMFFGGMDHRSVDIGLRIFGQHGLRATIEFQ